MLKRSYFPIVTALTSSLLLPLVVSAKTAKAVPVRKPVVISRAASKVKTAAVSNASLAGRKIFSGKVTAISGEIISIDGKDRRNDAVDVSQAKLTRGAGGVAIALSGIRRGDMLTISGSMNNGMIIATAVNDSRGAAKKTVVSRGKKK